MADTTCSICSTLPEKCSEDYLGGNLDSAPFPDAIARLQLVSNALPGGSLFLCPECLTGYRRETDRFNVANGPEESGVTFFRLSAAELATASGAIGVAEAKQKARK